MKRSDLLKGIVITAEVCGTELSKAAAEVMVRELEQYPIDAVVDALKRCRREVTGRLSLAAIVARINDGHPGVEEAWALCPRDESQTVVWTDEICEAFGSVLDLLAADDAIGARMAFKERYTALVREARDERKQARWSTSLGHSVGGRNAPIKDAVVKGRLTTEQAAPMLVEENVYELPQLTAGERERPPESAAALLKRMGKKN